MVIIIQNTKINLFAFIIILYIIILLEILQYNLINKSKKKRQIVFILNQVIKTKKPHACGCNEWTIVRIGADYKIKCNNCERIILVDSTKLNKIVKKQS